MTETKSWGRIAARPHEFLIVMNGGVVDAKRSGQGRSVFVWPWESVAVLPTSIRKLSFRADQVTLEKAGVEVTGLAVYRLCEPLLAFRMFDGDVGALGDILRDMFVGATRRIVAGLRLDECITHRKERVAAALMEEIAPVLAGEGSTSDATTRGWGVVLDTIEIQDVRVLSQEVFARLQVPYREALALDALVARDRVLKEEARLDVERRRVAEHARNELMNEEEARLARERQRQVEARAHEDGLARQKLALEREASEQEAELERLRRTADVDLSEARLRELMLTETMPRMAEAFRGTFERVNLTTTDGHAFSAVVAALAPLLAAAQLPRGHRG